jgi:hypothetical protein
MSELPRCEAECDPKIIDHELGLKVVNSSSLFDPTRHSIVKTKVEIYCFAFISQDAF